MSGQGPFGPELSHAAPARAKPSLLASLAFLDRVSLRTGCLPWTAIGTAALAATTTHQKRKTNEQQARSTVFDHASIVLSYARAEAIADGVLVDCSDLAREAGWKIPVAMTSAVWEDCVHWTPEDSSRKRCLQDEPGRMWDVVWMAMVAARRHVQLCQVKASLDLGRCAMVVYRVPRGGTSIEPECVELKIIIDGGDTGQPVATILETLED